MKRVFLSVVLGVLMVSQAQASIILWDFVHTQKGDLNKALGVWDTLAGCKAGAILIEKSDLGVRYVDGKRVYTEKLADGLYKTTYPDGSWVGDMLLCLPDVLNPNDLKRY